MLFLIGWLKDVVLSSTDSFRPPPPWRSLFRFFLFRHHGTPGPHWSWGHSRLKRVTSVVKKIRDFFFFSNETCWRVFGFKWKHMYIYIYVWIYIGSREMIFEIFSLRSCCLMKWRLFQLVSLQNEAYQSAVGSCPYFLLDFLVTPIFVAKAKSEGGKASILHLIYWHVGVGMVWRMHEITFTLEIPTVPTTVAFKKRSSSQGFHVNLGLINHPVS